MYEYFFTIYTDLLRYFQENKNKRKKESLRMA